MQPGDRRSITLLMQDVRAGNPRAGDELLEAVYDELRRLAAVRLRGERAGCTLDATALVHEAYLRLLGGEDADWANRSHFFAAAAEAMRRVLVDRARHHLAQKRGGGDRPQALPDEIESTDEDGSRNLLALDLALQKFEQVDAEKSALVKLRYFAGLTEEQAATALGISRATAARQWAFARAWLYDEITRQRLKDGSA